MGNYLQGTKIAPHEVKVLVSGQEAPKEDCKEDHFGNICHLIDSFYEVF